MRDRCVALWAPRDDSVEMFRTTLRIPMSETPPVILEKRDAAFWITINRRVKRNALDTVCSASAPLAEIYSGLMIVLF